MEKTIENLTKAFIGESQARNRYSVYSKLAKKEGYEQIEEVFLLTADNEREHAKWLFRMINDLKKKMEGNLEEIKIEAGASTVLGDTIENLKSAIAGENYENITMYPEFARVAEEESLQEIADRLRAIAKAEEHHEGRFRKLLKEVEGGTIFKKEEKMIWICRKCGYAHEGTGPPEECPSCSHPKNYFQLKCEEY